MLEKEAPCSRIWVICKKKKKKNPRDVVGRSSSTIKYTKKQNSKQWLCTHTHTPTTIQSSFLFPSSFLISDSKESDMRLNLLWTLQWMPGPLKPEPFFPHYHLIKMPLRPSLFIWRYQVRNRSRMPAMKHDWYLRPTTQVHLITFVFIQNGTFTRGHKVVNFL